MARPTKIEKHGLVDKVIDLRNNGKTYNDIVIIVKKEDNITLSDMAVKRFLDKYEDKVDEKAIEVIKEDKRRVMKTVNHTYDIIESQLDISNRVLNKLDDIDSIENILRDVSGVAIQLIKEQGYKVSPGEFAHNIEKSISKNIKDYTMLTREVRENNKFLADLKSKIYDFQIIQEFISLFIEEFEKYDKETTLKVLNEIATNNRLKWLAEEQLRIRGDR